MYYNVITEKTVMLPIYEETIGVNHRQGPIERPYGYPYDHLLAVSDGSGILNYNGEEYVLEKGCLCYIRRDIPHFYYPTSKQLITSFVTFGGKGSDCLTRYYSLPDFILKNDAPKEFWDGLMHLNTITGMEGKERDISVSLYTLLHVGFGFLTMQTEGKYERLNTVIKYINENFSGDLILSDLSRIYDSSDYTFCRDFKKEFSETPFNYILKTRISYAKTLLLSDRSITVKDIASRCGFRDTSYFCRTFRRFEGISPNKFRKKFLA